MLNSLSHLAARAIKPEWSPRAAILLLLATMLSACSAPEIPGLYKIDIQQGNVVTQEMLAQLEPGMDKRRVRFVLGTPMVADTFNDDRWDYIYTYKAGGEDRMQRNITVFFEDGRLARLDGDVERAVLRPKAPERRDTIVKVKGPREERGFLAALNPFSGTAERDDDASDQPEEKDEDATAALKPDPTGTEQSDGTAAARQDQEKDTVVTPTGGDAQREPQPLAPAGAVDDEADKVEAATDASQTEATTSGQAALTRPVESEPTTPGSIQPPAADEPSWWERVKQRVGVSSTETSSSEDNATDRANDSESGTEQASDGDREQRSAAIEAAPDAVTPESTQEPASSEITTATAESAPGASDGTASAEASPAEPTGGDGGFFDRIRDRFKIPELPPLPTVKAPGDFNPDSGDP